MFLLFTCIYLVLTIFMSYFLFWLFKLSSEMFGSKRNLIFNSKRRVYRFLQLKVGIQKLKFNSYIIQIKDIDLLLLRSAPERISVPSPLFPALVIHLPHFSLFSYPPLRAFKHLQRFSRSSWSWMKPEKSLYLHPF